MKISQKSNNNNNNNNNKIEKWNIMITENSHSIRTRSKTDEEIYNQDE